MIGASTCDKSHDDLSLRHGKLTNMSDEISRSITSAVSHRTSQSHQLVRPLPQVQPPSRQRAPLRLLKSYVNVLACNTIMLHFSGDSSGFK